MNERLKEIRSSLGHSQEKFGKVLGVTNTAISGYESGRRNLTDQMIISICREFNVNEEWLRYGTGEMFIELPEEDEFFKAATELSKNNDRVAMQAVIEYWKLNKESKEVFKEFITRLVEKANE